MKKIMFSIIALLFLLNISGCWNYKELNDYSIVSGLAIDKNDNEYEVSVLIANSPKGNTDSSSNEAKIVVFSGKGETIFKAIKDIGLISSKELYLKGFSILVISEDVAKEGIYNAIDFFLRYSSSINDFDVVIAKDTKAKNTLKIMTALTNFPSQNISDNIKSTNNLQGIVKTTNFDDLTSILLRKGIDPTLNTISVIGDVKEGSTTENLESSQPGTYVKIGNLAIFKNDKLVDFSSHNESIGINMINNNISEMYLKVDYKGGYVVVDTTKFSSSIDLKIKNGKSSVDINLKGEAKIIEVSGDINLEDFEVIKKLENKANKLIKNYANEAIQLAKKNSADIFGIGLKFNQNHPKYYNKIKDDWYDVFNNMDFNINSELNFKNKVSAKNSLEAIYERQQ